MTNGKIGSIVTSDTIGSIIASNARSLNITVRPDFSKLNAITTTENLA